MLLSSQHLLLDIWVKNKSCGSSTIKKPVKINKGVFSTFGGSGFKF